MEKDRNFKNKIDTYLNLGNIKLKSAVSVEFINFFIEK